MRRRNAVKAKAQHLHSNSNIHNGLRLSNFILAFDPRGGFVSAEQVSFCECGSNIISGPKALSERSHQTTITERGGLIRSEYHRELNNTLDPIEQLTLTPLKHTIPNHTTATISFPYSLNLFPSFDEQQRSHS
ncbi:hypothetical protein LSTR_LSTR013180 [Laodelphax striatellus]|uniref:Uncharacterized protein n=1 Tax=Laodelphax striatellus TaxID=195883 RepID=A0A482XFD1_LAOST|nr:hypothetical protein LSTR_LSTR013180 [Laodelphax striatellus]